ncbi:hypothetical protein ABPG75_007726 [Micractinium tetrahymenae]
MALLAACLPIRERFGVLPLLNRHWHEASQRQEIGGLGISELFLPCTRLSTQALQQRSERVLAWLAAHIAQLGRLRCDLQQHLKASFYHSFSSAYKHLPATRAAIQPAVLQAQWEHRSAFTSLLLHAEHLDAALAAAEGGAPADSGLAPQQLTELRLSWDTSVSIPQGLLAAADLPAGLCAALRCINIKNILYSSTAFQPAWLAACSTLASLNLALSDEASLLHEGITRLRSLRNLRVYAPWCEVPELLGQLPLTSLSLQGCKFPGAAIQDRLHGGMRAMAGLAPTLQDVGACSLEGPEGLDLLTKLDATKLRRLTLHGFVDRDDELECSTLEDANILDDLAALTYLHLRGIQGEAVPPAGEYLSRLRCLRIGGDNISVAWLPAGLSAATGLKELRIQNHAQGLDALWEQLAELLPHWPLLQEMEVYEVSDVESMSTSVLTGDLLENMGL